MSELRFVVSRPKSEWKAKIYDEFIELKEELGMPYNELFLVLFSEFKRVRDNSGLSEEQLIEQMSMNSILGNSRLYQGVSKGVLSNGNPELSSDDNNEKPEKETVKKDKKRANSTQKVSSNAKAKPKSPVVSLSENKKSDNENEDSEAEDKEDNADEAVKQNPFASKLMNKNKF